MSPVARRRPAVVSSGPVCPGSPGRRTRRPDAARGRARRPRVGRPGTSAGGARCICSRHGRTAPSLESRSVPFHGGAYGPRAPRDPERRGRSQAPFGRCRPVLPRTWRGLARPEVLDRDGIPRPDRRRFREPSDGADPGSSAPSWDVEFVDGTRVDMFVGCDEVSDLASTDGTSAQLASQSLLTHPACISTHIEIVAPDSDPSVANLEDPRARKIYLLFPSLGPIKAFGDHDVSIVEHVQ